MNCIVRHCCYKLTTLFKKQLSAIGSYGQELVCITSEDANKSTASLELNHSGGSWVFSLEIVLQTSTNLPQLSCKLSKEEELISPFIVLTHKTLCLDTKAHITGVQPVTRIREFSSFISMVWGILIL